MPAAEKMDVEMVHRLTAVRTRVDREAISVAAPLFSETRRNRDDPPQEHLAARLGEFGRGRKMTDGHHEEMQRCLRVDIFDRDDVRIAIDFLRGNLPTADLAK